MMIRKKNIHLMIQKINSNISQAKLILLIDKLNKDKNKNKQKDKIKSNNKNKNSLNCYRIN